MSTEKETARPITTSSSHAPEEKGKAPAREARGPKIPSTKELEEKQGDKPGAIHLDIDLATGEVKEVPIDPRGKVK